MRSNTVICPKCGSEITVLRSESTHNLCKHTEYLSLVVGCKECCVKSSFRLDVEMLYGDANAEALIGRRISAHKQGVLQYMMASRMEEAE